MVTKDRPEIQKANEASNGEEAPEQQTLATSEEEYITLSPDEEKRLIQNAYRRLLRSINSLMDDQDRRDIRKAYEMAVEAHSKQRRKSGEPYILHPIAVATICAEEIGLGPTAVVAALLHDVVEDTDITLEQIKLTFGSRMAKMVDGLTKLDSAYNAESPQAENFKKVLSTMVEDVRIVLIKMADRLHNMRTLGSMPRHKQLKIAAETSYIYAPLAHRLGLFAVKTEFEDLCFKITHYDDYKEISRKLAETKRSRNRYIHEFIRPIKEELDKNGIKSRILGRPKSIYSIYRKVHDKGVPFEEVYDLFAIRVIIDVPITEEKDLCWRVYSLVTGKYIPVVERLRDWISTPKANGYESLHTTILGPKGRYVEVQIRTERMDEIAERGVAAHWKYKNVRHTGGGNDVFEQWLTEIRELLKNPNEDAIEFLHDFKTNLFAEEVHVYTPKGDIKILPKGSTVLDFAFSVHTEVGYRCAGAKVNNRIMPLNYQLKSGDQVIILTKKGQTPTDDWLKMVVTGKAKSKIRAAIREEKKKQGEMGREYLERKLNSLKITFEEGIEYLLQQYNLPTRLDLYSAIAAEQIDLKELNKLEVQGGKIMLPSRSDKEVKPVAAERPAKTSGGNYKLRINGDNADLYAYTFATCCNPIPGDEIFGFITTKAMVTIHRVDCSNAQHLMSSYSYRVLKADWVDVSNTPFVAELKITGIDEIGVVQRLTKVITDDLGVNMRSITMSGENSFFEGTIKVVVKNADQLNQLIRKIKSVSGVSNVLRTD